MTILGIDVGKTYCDWCLYTQDCPVLEWHHGYVNTSLPAMLPSMGTNEYDVVAIEGFTMLPGKSNLRGQRQSEVPRIIGRLETEAASFGKRCVVVPVAEVHRVLRIPRGLSASGIKRARRAAVELFCPNIIGVPAMKFRQHQIDALAAAITAASMIRAGEVLGKAR